MKIKPSPMLLSESKRDQTIIVQIHEKRRNAQGRLVAVGSRSLTVYNGTVAGVYDTIKRALSTGGGRDNARPQACRSAR